MIDPKPDPDLSTNIDKNKFSLPDIPGEPNFSQESQRYEQLELLGEGGMGKVYKARDPRLNRTVALKFLRGDEPEMVRRFTLEAQAQARIQHDHVCKIYEVGQTQGRPYIAMQYIPGQPFNELIDKLNQLEKIQIMKTVAEAVHEAHRTGIIHRDIKPGNIMLERDENGSWRPYIMDFGLAREVATSSLTVTGEILGSPSYMAPEQARGDIHHIDRRTDIHGLGATLYFLLGGEPPYNGRNPAEILVKLLHEDPLPLRRQNSSIPRDLETITMKCLEKDQSRRYQTARELAEDLGRFLEGEPIQGRRVSLTYRLRKKIHKNRALSLVVAIALILITALTTIYIKSRWDTARQTEWAQRFGQRVQEIESIMRFASMLPLHDTQRERVLVSERMTQIQADMNQLGRIGQGPGCYALGRGHLALHKYDSALVYLQQAWQNGYQAAEVAHALGQAMGELYQRSLQDEVNRIPSKEMREARRAEIKKTYRDPALHFLKIVGPDQTGAPEYGEGLIAYYEERYEDARTKAEQAYQSIPWYYEAGKMVGDAWMALGKAKSDRGDYAGALSDYHQAGQAYARVLETARSAVDLYLSECQLQTQLMELAILRGEQPQSTFEQALAMADRALTVDPSSDTARLKKAAILCRFGEYTQDQRGDPRRWFSQAVAEGQAALGRDPNNLNTHNILGRTFWRQGEYDMGHGVDPCPSFNQAMASFQKALAIEPDNAVVNSNLAAVNAVYGIYMIDTGADPRPWLEKAVAGYRQSIADNPRLVSTWVNLATAYQIRGNYETKRGLDPRSSLEESIKCCQEAINLNPNFTQIYRKIGDTLEMMGEYEMDHGRDPRPYFERAIPQLNRCLQLNPKYLLSYVTLGITFSKWGEYELYRGLAAGGHFDQSVAMYRQALAISPNNLDMLNNLGNTYLTKAQLEMETGINPNHSFQEAQTAFDQAIRINSADPYVSCSLGWLHVLRAENVLRQGQNPLPETGLAMDSTKRTLAINPTFDQARNYQGISYRQRATYFIFLGKDPGGDLAAGRRAFESASKINPNYFWTWLDLGRTELIAARWSMRRRASPEGELEQAKQALQKALALNSTCADALQGQAEVFYLKAMNRQQRGKPAEAEIKAGEDLVNRALSINPRLNAARALRGAFIALKSQLETNPDHRLAALKEAQGLLEQAMGINPLLRELYHDAVQLIQDAGSPTNKHP